MDAFLIALQFLTRLPVLSKNEIQSEQIGRSVLYYPLVGAVIGAILMLTAWITALAPPLVGAALVLTAWAAVTGALHLDGLADSADAWVGGHGDRERTLAIMKDPACGPMGVTALVAVLLVKFAALAALLGQGAWSALLLAPVVGRVAVVALLRWTPYVRPGGLGSPQSSYLPQASVSWVLAATALFLVVIGGGAMVAVMFIAAGVFLWLRSLMIQRLGGTTGDTAGALVEVIEAVVLIALAW